MAELLKRRGAAANVEAAIQDGVEESSATNAELNLIHKNLNLKKVVSTGSTLLDLAISGGNTEEGGIPGGMFVEIFGPSGAGKTAILSEIAASTQNKGGAVRFCDPEARLDKEYSTIYGVSMSEDKFDYYRPDTVSSLFTDYLWPWQPPNPNVINMFASDSIAALSTDQEMDNDEGDKMGMRRAKEFSEGLRKTCRLVANRQWLIVFSNQIRSKGTSGGTTTPGGMGVPFYASLRIQIKPSFPRWEISKKAKLKSGVEVEQTIGVHSTCSIMKSSIDIPYREAPLSIIFGYGIDTIRDELQYYKDMTKGTSYDCFSKTYVSMQNAITYIEENNLQRDLKLRTIGLWREIQEQFKIQRSPKKR